MTILYLAPQPFFIERGTPIAVRMSLETMDARGDEVDLVTYHEGEDVNFRNVKVHRIPPLSFLSNVKAGFSLKKVACDLLMAVVIVRLLFQKRYDIVHAVEESVFLALLIKVFARIPYVYDMDSSLSEQIVDKYPGLRIGHRLLSAVEGVAVRHAVAVVAVCDALGDVATRLGARRVTLLYDVPMASEGTSAPEDLRAAVGAAGALGMYIGNLESYQGIDLLLSSVAAGNPDSKVDIVVIGGAQRDIERYREEAIRLSVESRVHFVGPRPLAQIYGYLEQADFLVSPRIAGQNTPMKIYSYLESGKAIVATRLRTHTQALDDDVALLADANPSAFGAAIDLIAQDPALRARIGSAGKRRVAERYNRGVFDSTLRVHLEGIEAHLGAGRESNVKAGQTAQA